MWLPLTISIDVHVSQLVNTLCVNVISQETHTQLYKRKYFTLHVYIGYTEVGYFSTSTYSIYHELLLIAMCNRAE